MAYLFPPEAPFIFAFASQIWTHLDTKKAYKAPRIDEEFLDKHRTNRKQADQIR